MSDPLKSPPEPLTLLDGPAEGVELTLVAAPGRDAVVSAAAARRLISVHTWELVAELGHAEKFSASPPGLGEALRAALDTEGRVKLGTVISPGDVLVGKQGPRFLVGLSPEEQRLAANSDQPQAERDGSLRCPPDVRGVVTALEADAKKVSLTIRREQALAIGDLLRLDSGELAVVGAIEPTVAGGDLAWPGLTGAHRVQKLATAEDCLEARSIGPYSLVTQQPLGAKHQFGGQRVGARALAALLNRGASVVVHEMLTVKSDDVAGRFHLYESIVIGRPECQASMPAGTRVVEAELRALGFGVDLADDRPRLKLLTTAAIRALAPKEVTKPETLNYRTLFPEPGGLFCVDIFGAFGTEDRRSRLGRIELPIPLLPPWSRSAVGLLLGLAAEELQAKLSGGGEENEASGGAPGRVPSLEVRDALAALDVAKLSQASDARGDLLRDLHTAGLSPSDLLVEAWPVLPPDLRPLVPLPGGRFATSDLNDLYRRLINRAHRLRRLLELNAPDIILVNESRMLQLSLDQLVHNGAWSPAVTGPNRRPLVSLAHLVAGPRGRFATLTNGKRVDYSGRARVVERADLPAGRALVPREVALELFKPWIYATLESEGLVTTIKAAKRMVHERHPAALAALERVIPKHPVILLPEGDSDAVLSLDLELWDQPALALPPSAIGALGLEVGAAVAIHVPVDPLAVEEARSRLRGMCRLEPEKVDDGWLSRATRSSCDALGALLFEAALHEEADPATSRTARLILARLI